VDLAQDRPVDETQLITALAQTGADVVQSALGLTGQGVRVAVMDTGVDYHHPDLGGCFGEGCRVERGHDFVGDAFDANPNNPTYNPVPVPDPDPDDCGGHGTHVAGIVGANGVLKGVAPGVTLLAYRVFGCVGSTSSDIMLAAMERAHDDGAQVLNMSIGSAFQWPQYPTAAGADRLARRGVVVVASIGNNGANGLYSGSAPGVGQGVIGVASFDNTHANLVSIAISPDNTLAGYNPASGAPAPPVTGSLPLARTGTPTTADDGCAALAPGSLTGQAALIRRGTCSFYVKAFNAQSAGAAAVVLYNNVAGALNPTVAGTPPITIPVVAISADNGVLVDGRIAAGPTDMTWTNTLSSDPLPTGGLISGFSSYGLPPDLSFKPDLGAPGGNIRSTIPLEQGAYGPNSGTSMSSPHVAGAVALLLEGRPSERRRARELLQNNADPKNWFGNPSLGFLDNTHRQGAGMLRIDEAIKANAIVTPSSLALGEFETPATTQTHTLKIKRDLSPYHTGGRAPVTYTLGHETALATGANTFTPAFFDAFATVAFSVPTVTVTGRMGASEVDVTFTPPSNAAARLFGGYVTLTPDDGSPVLRVPYAGYNGDYQAIPALVPTVNNFPWLAKLQGTTFVNQPSGASFTLAGGDVPYVLLHLDHGVTKIVAQVFNAASGLFVGYAPTQQFMPRNSAAASFFAVAWDGAVSKTETYRRPRPLANGMYRIQLSVLKALGDEGNPAHWESWTSPNITIARPPAPPAP
jgi:subtilisin family serine protease